MSDQRSPYKSYLNSIEYSNPNIGTFRFGPSNEYLKDTLDTVDVFTRPGFYVNIPGLIFAIVFIIAFILIMIFGKVNEPIIKNS